MSRTPLRPDWLTARPIAHRGFHRKHEGVIENTPTAARDAIARGYAIECDVQLTKDGEAVVFHDHTLDRLTEATGPVIERTAAELGGIALRGASDRIVPLANFLALIGGRTPLICEIKSRFDADMRLTDRTAAVVSAYAGPVALKSFDPDIVGHLRRDGARLGVADRPLGIIAEEKYEHAEYARLTPERRRDMAELLHWRDTDPDFLSYNVKDMPNAASLFPRLLGAPVMTWTVRTPAQVETARRYADQMVFEGFTP
jgi:glycerophosphoryl diester phosphodiesterase